ncbi:MAG: hypothetical protein PW789_06280 [Edaphobacter sp.]|uniref:hypothetical protein n=1 Tax=Edaphobacter sp. TaxID=1934404 RepID=UPI002391038E|nr:hypothetical protein [Edaphobacter sp.]MDE1176201.1 hypothetical protein [Edaphobacter sp.]
MMILGLWLQEAGSISAGNSRLLMFFVGMVAFAMLVQAVVVVIAAIGAAKARSRVIAIVEEVRSKTMPVLDSAQEMVNDLHPKVRIIAENLVETSHVVRSKAQEFDATISDVNLRARAQTERMDDMVSSVLDSTVGIASTIQRSVTAPVREFNGLMSGLKAGIDTLVGRGRNGNRPRDDQDE